MTRELKLSLIIGFSLVLLVAVLISDHLGRGDRIVLAGAPDDLPAGITPINHRQATHDDIADRFAISPNVQTPTQPIDPERRLEKDVPATAVLARTDRQPAATETPGGSTDVHGFPPGMFVTVDDPIVINQSGGVGVKPDLARAPELTTPSRNDPRQSTTPTETAWVTVAQGETLFKIATRHLGNGHRWREIAELNADRVGKDGSVRAGVRIRVPVTPSSKPRESEVVRMAQQPERAQPARGSAPASATDRTYVVARNDTLGEIAQSQLGTIKRLNELRALNKDVLKGKDVIRPGMVLRLPNG